MKRLRYALLPLLLLFPLSACSQEATPPEDAPAVVTAERVADAFNAALETLEAAGSYTMTGNLSSTAEVIPADGSEGELVNLHFPLCTTFEDGSFLNLSEGGDAPHTTYFDGTYYYISVPTGDTPYRYRTPAGDYNDYTASDYLRPIDAEAVFSPSVTENADGSTELSFRIPCGLYDSNAVYGLLGELLDEGHAADRLQLRLTIGADGSPTAFYLFFSTTTAFADDSIRQELAISLTLSDFSTTIVARPDGLDAYLPLEDSGTLPDEEGFYEIPAEDLG